MGDLTKWETKAATINIIFPIAGVVALLLLIVVMTVIKPKQPENQKKKPKEAAGMVELGSEEEEVDWGSF